MLELGTMSRQLHENVGEFVAASKADILVCYGDNSRYTAEKAKELGILNSRFFDDKNELADYLKEIIKKNDLILFKASRGIKLEEVVEKLYK